MCLPVASRAVGRGRPQRFLSRLRADFFGSLANKQIFLFEGNYLVYDGSRCTLVLHQGNQLIGAFPKLCQMRFLSHSKLFFGVIDTI